MWAIWISDGEISMPTPQRFQSEALALMGLAAAVAAIRMSQAFTVEEVERARVYKLTGRRKEMIATVGPIEVSDRRTMRAEDTFNLAHRDD
jgi:hypothetical protein